MTLYEHVKQQPVQWIASISSASKPAAVVSSAFSSASKWSAVPASRQHGQQACRASRQQCQRVLSASPCCDLPQLGSENELKRDVINEVQVIESSVPTWKAVNKALGMLAASSVPKAALWHRLHFSAHSHLISQSLPCNALVRPFVITD